MGKFDPPKPKVEEPEPIPPPEVAVEDAGEEVRKRKAMERKKKGRMANILSLISPEEAEEALLGRPGGKALPSNLIGRDDTRR